MVTISTYFPCVSWDSRQDNITKNKMQEYRMKKDQPKYLFANDMIIFTEKTEES